MTVFLIIAITAVLLCGLYLFSVLPGDSTKALRFKNAKFAHRGLHSCSAPENSLKAFSEAVEASYGIELDVRLAADGKLVVFHDKNTKRMCGVDLLVSESTYDQLSDLRLLESEQRIPLLSEVLELVGGKVPLLVEIKCSASAKRTCTALKALLDDYGGDYCIESFNPLALAYFRKHSPDTVRGQLASTFFKEERTVKGIAKTASALFVTNALSRPHFIAYNHKCMNTVPVKLCRKFGALVFAWTVIGEDTVIDGADAIIFEKHSNLSSK